MKQDGTVVATGFNDYGQCDVGDWKDIEDIYPGDSHTIAVKTEGTFMCTVNE